MARTSKPYADGGTFSPQARLSTEWLDPGFYKVRLFGGGPWVPIRVDYMDGERDPETWELLSDQKLIAEWWPQTNSGKPFSVDPVRFFGRAFPIDRSEFQWLMQLRTIRR